MRRARGSAARGAACGQKSSEHHRGAGKLAVLDHDLGCCSFFELRSATRDSSIARLGYLGFWAQKARTLLATHFIGAPRKAGMPGE